jgi:transposase
VTVQIVRDWVERFNTQGPEELLNVKAPGKCPKLNDDQRQELRRLVEKGPIPAIQGVVRWRLKDLARLIFEDYRQAHPKTNADRDQRQNRGVPDQCAGVISHPAINRSD